MPKRLFLIMIAILALMLVACDGDDEDENGDDNGGEEAAGLTTDALQRGMTDLINGNPETAAGFTCDAEAEQIRESANIFTAQNAEANATECVIEGDTFRCTATFNADNEGETMAMVFTANGDVQDDKVCNVEVEVEPGGVE